MFLGTVEIGTIDEWKPRPGFVTSWCPSSASLAKARLAPVSDVPVGAMQAQHLRGFCEQAAKGLDYSRLLIVTCDVPGHHDVRALTYVINAHLRRHDTYRSWFEYNGPGDIVRHTMQDPRDIAFVPVEHGEMSAAQMRELIVATPDPVHWDCFRFGVIQGPDRFTMFLSIDHLHTDTMIVAMAITEFQMMYAALVAGSAPITLPKAGSYDDFCIRQDKRTSVLTLDSPQVRAWIEYAGKNDGSLPDFPLPLGDPAVPCTAGLLAIRLMDEEQTTRFESACIDAGARFIGGIMAAAALAEHELTGARSYYGLTPVDTRSTPEDFMTAGWCTGLVPISVPDATSFAEAARAAQESFDTGLQMAHVPFQRVLELAPWLSWPRPNNPVINFFDAGVGPLAAYAHSKDDSMNLAAYSDGRYSYQLTLFVARFEQKTEMTVIYPKNPIAEESITRYADAMKSVCARIAERRGVVPLSHNTSA